MLEQMSSPAYAHGGEVAVVRTIEGRPCGDASSEASSDTPEEQDLPQCKIRRNYNCAKCIFFTQNPRVYLAHARDTHNERIKIYDCPHCVYASRHHQKLLRHVKMLHNNNDVTTVNKTEPVPLELGDDVEDIEDMLEEVSQDSADPEMEITADTEDESNQGFTSNGAEGAAGSFQCPQCEFITQERSELTKHSQSAHLQAKYFSCGKCSYVTHIRARFTKHVKYHSMPMIKCTLCDFRTPYKWNLDRHMKNHGGTGSFVCCMCNFTADIKQSMTVHEMNHHTSLVGHAAAVASRRRNKVGASDSHADDEPHMLREDDASMDSHSDVGSIQYLAAEMASFNSESNDLTIEPCHSQQDNDGAVDMSDSQQSFQNVCSALEYLKQSRKMPRPIPKLIPLNSSTPTAQAPSKTSPTEPPLKKFKDMFSGNIDLDILNYSSTDIFKVDRMPEETPISLTNSPLTNSSNPPRKKNETFFDKLKERLLTETGGNGTLTCKNCGFESKCLSEHSVHEKNCAMLTKNIIPNASLTSLGSTRCQNCRHRCKSSADLYVHMQTCNVNNTNEIANKFVSTSTDQNDQVEKSREEESEQPPHPMENVVFVWNTLSKNQDQGNLSSQLDIVVNEDTSLAELNGRIYDPNNVDALHDNEANSLSPTQVAGKKVFKCPHCPFWASTASRFHVHIVGHLNKKPFECSLCNYRSNWRWDITKHIKLKSVRDPEHNNAKVLMTDETGRRNYSKYNKFLATLSPDQQAKSHSQSVYKKQMHDITVNVDEPDNLSANSNDNSISPGLTIMPLNLQKTQSITEEGQGTTKKSRKTLWKCKRCNYKNPSKEALLEHVREHSKAQTFIEDDSTSVSLQQKKSESNTKDPDQALAYQCGHCNQLSNWKHVIQRHCRLKHNGVINVITTERPKQDLSQMSLGELNTDFCTKCPFKTTDKKHLYSHMQQHTPSPQSIFKCYFCPYFVKNESDLMQHLLLHGINDPEEYVSRAMDGKSQQDVTMSTKRHKCLECPYETNSKSQYMYHEQFHRLPANTPYKCQVCNYSVTKRHLLHQHMKVHGVNKKETFSETETTNTQSLPTDLTQNQATSRYPDSSEDIPYVWVSAKNEFHKMYKCRYCSYVNSQQCKIPNHEKIHCLWYDNDMVIYKCLECKFTCDTAVRLTEHSSMHGEIYGRIYCPVDPEVSDEEQIANLRLLLEEEKKLLMEAYNKKETENEVDMEKNTEAGRTLYFCTKCPSRFFVEGELNIHNRFHELNFAIQCKICTFTVPQESQMAAHAYIHTEDYQSKTKMLQIMHETHPDYPQPNIVAITCPTTDELIWIVSAGNKPVSASVNTRGIKKAEASTSKSGTKQFACEHCPAKFFKTSALNYHLSLHGGEGPHTCKKCDYTVKNIGNLAKHELVHKTDDKSVTNNDYKADFDSGDDMDFKNVPLSGTDLFQRKTEAEKRVHNNDKLIMRPNDHFPPVLQADPQFGYLMHGNPEFIYPTYLKNGRQKEKRYKCHKCPSAFEKREQYKVHLSLHGSKQRYKCELCDYSVKYYANYVQHMRKHQMNAEAQAERHKGSDCDYTKTQLTDSIEESGDNIKLAIKTMPKYTAKSDFMQFSIGDQQTLRLLQRRRSSTQSCKDTVPSDVSPEKDKKMHVCFYCPYTNQRRDALENHMRRHKCVSGVEGNHNCTHCDFSANQSHFVRDHLKIHFNAHKSTQPECFVQSEGVVLTITKLDEDNHCSEMCLSDIDIDEKTPCPKGVDKIFVQPATGEITV